MKLTSNMALELLENSRGLVEDDSWITHCICVGNSAGKIAQKLNLDEDFARTLGYIHDIGKRDRYNHIIKTHELNGYEYIKSLGYDEKYASICIIHSFLNNDINCVAGGIPSENRYKYDFTKEYVRNHKYTIYEKIINLCDLMCKYNNMTLEKRIIELMLRKGCHENTVYHITEAQKLKNEIDNMLGCSVYSLFDNLEI